MNSHVGGSGPLIFINFLMDSYSDEEDPHHYAKYRQEDATEYEYCSDSSND